MIWILLIITFFVGYLAYLLIIDYREVASGRTTWDEIIAKDKAIIAERKAKKAQKPKKSNGDGWWLAFLGMMILTGAYKYSCGVPGIPGTGCDSDCS
jgi:hypothetical protein